MPKFLNPITITTPGASAPLIVNSSTLVSNLNSDLLDGQHGSYFENRDTTAVGFSGGTITLTRSAGNLTVSLDGRYLPLAGGTTTGAVTFGSTVVFGSSGKGRIYADWAADSSTRSFFAGRNSTDTDWNWGAEFGWDGANQRWYFDTVPFINGNAALHAGNYGGYSTFSGTVTGSSFSGAGTGLTGTAASLTAGAVPWSGVTGKPTTLAGYGITDALSSTINQQGGKAYTVHDFNTYPSLYDVTFVNPTGSTNLPTGMAAVMSYRFIMGAGDTAGRGFDLVGAAEGSGNIYIRERSIGTWSRVLHSNNFSSYALPLTGGTLTGALSGTTAAFSGAITQSGNQVLHAGNYTSYAPGLGTSNTFTNVNYFRSNVGNGVYLGSTNTPPLQAFSSDGGAAFMSFHRGGAYAVNLGLDPDNVLRIGGWSAAANRWQLDMSGNQTLAGNLTAVNGVFSGPITQGGNQVVHSGNVASYALPIGGGTVTGQVLIGSHMSLNSSASIMGQVGFNRNAATGAIFNASYGAYQLQNNTGTLELQVYTAAGGFTGAHTFSNNGNVAFLTGTVTAGGNQIVHAGNVSTYALPIGGGTLNGNLTMGSGYQHRASDGTAAAPGYSFSAETGTGMYRAGANTLGFATGGVQRLSINGSGNATLTGAMTASSFSGAGTGLTGTASSLTAGAVAWSGITSKPTTISGFGITDIVSSNSGSPVAADTTTKNGFYYVNSNISLFGQTDGALFVQAYDNTWASQIYQDYRTGQLAIRGRNSGTWQAWRTVLDSTNFTGSMPNSGVTAGTYNTVTVNAKGIVTAGSNSPYMFTTGGTMTGSLIIQGGTNSLIAQDSGTASQWYGRVGSANGTSDRYVFLGTYGSFGAIRCVVNTTQADADLYINTVNGSTGGTVRMPASVLINGNQALHAGTTSAPSLSIGGSAGSVAASGITGQVGMWTSAARPGPYRLYRRDADDGYSVQTYWTGTRWRLYGYLADTAHADTHVGYADSAGSASSASSATNSTQLNGQAASYYENRDTTAVGISAGTLTLTRAAGNLTTTIGGRVVAWCEFNGNFASSQSPNAAFNVSSITKNATGDYTINFTNALANTNYVVAGTARLDTTNNTTNFNLYIGVARRSTAKTTTSCRIGCEWVNSTLFDAESVGVAFIAA